jgi:hypothetical protein
MVRLGALRRFSFGASAAIALAAARRLIKVLRIKRLEDLDISNKAREVKYAQILQSCNPENPAILLKAATQA